VPLFTDPVVKQKIDYIHHNLILPKWRLAEAAESYRWSSAGYYVNASLEWPFLTHFWYGRDLLNIANRNALTRFQFYKDSLSVVARNFYYAKCMKPLEKFSDAYKEKIYHFTLYFYDQANNLVKTIPPNGINYALFSNSLAAVAQLNNVRKFRANNHYPKPGTDNSTPAHYPAHKYPTYYQYNSLNQVTWQWSADAGGTRFVYDELRRLVRSHNANQRKLRFTYTLYDFINRVIESG